ncbi:hypothetical protein STIUS_v1c02690 [Spiroplasma sp. TIUS-1]|uniref:hypothetical protein n=1 Tax=Spiroplasma sp. TIUS-1 TaxID=216963 RepID=UPI001399151A|nr:hypothetical protein [Spiroplasma sp. TIUS-1]QHX35823.1 hypothetical protein STIUS_v1c02690 [Spiroplasma sp. TIUS-1]
MEKKYVLNNLLHMTFLMIILLLSLLSVTLFEVEGEKVIFYLFVSKDNFRPIEHSSSESMQLISVYSTVATILITPFGLVFSYIYFIKKNKNKQFYVFLIGFGIFHFITLLFNLICFYLMKGWISQSGQVMEINGKVVTSLNIKLTLSFVLIVCRSFSFIWIIIRNKMIAINKQKIREFELKTESLNSKRIPLGELASKIVEISDLRKKLGLEYLSEKNKLSEIVEINENLKIELDNASEISKDFNLKLSEISKNKNQLNYLEKQNEEVAVLIEEEKQKLSKAKATFESLNSSILSLEKDIKEKQKKSESMNAQYQKLLDLEKNENDLEKQNEKLVMSIEKQNEKLAMAKTTFESLNSSILSLEKDIKEKQEISESLDKKLVEETKHQSELEKQNEIVSVKIQEEKNKFFEANKDFEKITIDNKKLEQDIKKQEIHSNNMKNEVNENNKYRYQQRILLSNYRKLIASLKEQSEILIEAQARQEIELLKTKEEPNMSSERKIEVLEAALAFNEDQRKSQFEFQKMLFDEMDFNSKKE